MKKQLFENELKVGDKVIYTGLGAPRKGTIVKKGKGTTTVKLMFSTVKIKHVANVPASDLGISIVSY